MRHAGSYHGEVIVLGHEHFNLLNVAGAGEHMDEGRGVVLPLHLLRLQPKVLLLASLLNF